MAGGKEKKSCLPYNFPLSLYTALWEKSQLFSRITLWIKKLLLQCLPTFFYTSWHTEKKRIAFVLHTGAHSFLQLVPGFPPDALRAWAHLSTRLELIGCVSVRPHFKMCCILPHCNFLFSFFYMIKDFPLLPLKFFHKLFNV